MDFDIREIGATLLVGSFIFLIAEGLLSFVFRIDLTGFYQGEFFGFPGNLKAEHQGCDGCPRRSLKQYPIPFTVFLAISLVVGLIGEDLAMHIIDEQPDVISAPASTFARYASPSGNFLRVRFDSLSSKHRTRAAQLIEISVQDKCGMNRKLTVENELYSGIVRAPTAADSEIKADDSKAGCTPDTADITLTPLGKKFAQLKALQSICGAHPIGPLADQSNDARSSEIHAMNPLHLSWEDLWHELTTNGRATMQTTDERWQRLIGCLSASYYHAKNRTFLEPTIFDELRRIDIRRKLAGAFAFFALWFLWPAAMVVGSLSVWRQWQNTNTGLLKVAAAANCALLLVIVAMYFYRKHPAGQIAQGAIVGAIVAPFLIAVLTGLWRWLNAPVPAVDPTIHRRLTWLLFMSTVLMLALRFAHIGVTRGLDTDTLIPSLFAFNSLSTLLVYVVAAAAASLLLWHGFARTDAWPRPQNPNRSRIGAGLILIVTLAVFYIGGLHACAIESREFSARVFGYFSTIALYEESSGIGVPGDNPFGGERLQATLASLKVEINKSSNCCGAGQSGETPNPAGGSPTPARVAEPTSPIESSPSHEQDASSDSKPRW